MIQEFKWLDIRDTITTIDPYLSAIIDEIDPNSDYTFTKISYRYGDLILRDGQFQVPYEEDVLPLADSRISKHLQNQLSYNALPLGIIARNKVEVYKDINPSVFTLGIFGPGFDVGIYEAFGAQAPYSMSAGARTIFMIPKVNDIERFRKLKNIYDLHTHPPKNLFDQCHLFAELAKRLNAAWTCDIYFLNKRWLDNENQPVAWLKFYNYIQTKAWLHTEYARSRTVFDVSWQNFRKLMEDNFLRPDPYLIEILRHLIFIAKGIMPGFRATDNQELAAPTKIIQKAYHDVYGLKNYLPVLMHPDYFNLGDNCPIYYSLTDPTQLTNFPKKKNVTSAIDDMRGLMELINYFKHALTLNNLQFEYQNINELMRRVQFDFFHSEMHTFGGIKSSEKLADEDERFTICKELGYQGDFAYKGSYIRCCVRLK